METFDLVSQYFRSYSTTTMATRLDSNRGWRPSDGARVASPLGRGSESAVPPCSPAPEAVSAVRAGVRRSPLHHELNLLTLSNYSRFNEM